MNPLNIVLRLGAVGAGLLIALTPFGAVAEELPNDSGQAKTTETAAPTHPYGHLKGLDFWKAWQLERRSPTELTGATGPIAHPSQYGPKRQDPASGIPRKAYTPPDPSDVVNCPSTGCDFVPDVVLVKLRPDVTIQSATGGGVRFSASALDDFFRDNELGNAAAVFPDAARPGPNALIERPDGTTMAPPDLTRWYRVTLSDAARANTTPVDVKRIIQRLMLVEGVDYAEPEYLYAVDGEPVSTAGSTNTSVAASASPETYTDPLYPQQWHLQAANVPAAWAYLESLALPPGGSPDVVVAVIDTGVDYTHPDLAASMWINQAELNGTPGVDDDGNGYVDDLHGAHVIAGALSGNPQDDHGHGTHVAGIIAAQGGNNIGGVGVAPNVRIMAIKAAQYSGVLNATDVARGVNYAVSRGADVINMSFGGYGRSLVVEDALAIAFGSTVLVAAAGNDNRPNLHCIGGANLFPGSYIWVLGVMAKQQIPAVNGDNLAPFSNRDCITGDVQEYELMAPGTAVLSTLPQAGFGAWSGTSMAAPVVSGVAALARTRWPDKQTYPSRYIMGQISATGPIIQGYTSPSGQVFNYRDSDALAVVATSPQPELSYLEHWLFDTTGVSPGNDEDGIVDAGEIVELAIVVRNRWGRADNVQVLIEPIAEGVSQPDPYVQMLIDSVDYDAIGSFNIKDNGLVRDSGGQVVGVSNPFRFTTLSTTPNDHIIPFLVTMTAQNGYDPNQPPTVTTSRFNLLVQRGRELPRFIDADTTITKDDYWLIPDGILVEAGVTLTVEPGTQLQFFSTDPSSPLYTPPRAQIQVEGTLLFMGTPEEPIEAFTGLLYPHYPVIIRPDAGGHISLVNVKISNPYIGSSDPYSSINTFDENRVQRIEGVYFYQTVTDCVSRFLYYYNPPVWGQCTGFSVLSAPLVLDSRISGIGSRDSPTIIYSDLEQSLVETTYSRNSTISANDSVFLLNARKSYNNFPLIMTLIPGAAYYPPTFLRHIFPVDHLGYTYSLVSTNRALNSLQHVKTVHDMAQRAGGSMVWISDDGENSFLRDYRYDIATEINFQSQYGQMDCGLPAFGGVANCWELFNADGLLLGSISDTVNSPTKWLSGAPLSFDASVAQPGLGRLTMMNSAGGWLKTDSTNVTAALKLPSGTTAEDIETARQAQIDTNDFGDFQRNAFLNDWLSLDTNRFMKFIAGQGRHYVVPLAGNFWGTQSSSLIDAGIFDFNDDFNLALIQYQPILTVAAPETYPFVASIEFSDENGPTDQLGIGRALFTVSFNRDMATDVQPRVSFGPAEPFTDFILDGAWTSPRVWIGSFNIGPNTGDGFQYMRVTGGVAADNPVLVTGTDVGRFRFEVQTSGAASINLQATGVEGAVELFWTQTDFPILAGYNLYRSTSLAGTYTRVNTTTIPQGMTTWIDSNVVPGQPYFYYFTVVLTDLTESSPSNIASATPTDTVPPTVVHTPVTTASPGLPLTLRANVTDNVAVQSVRLFHRPMGGATYTQRPMVNVGGIEYTATLEGSILNSPGVEYYIEASDGVSVTRTGRADLPFQIIVVDRPTVTTVQPASGPAAGGTTVTVTGTNFKTGVSASLGGAACGSLVRLSSTQLTCVTPQSFPQTVDVVVRNPDTQQGVLLNGFTFISQQAALGFPSAQGGQGQIVEIPLNIANLQGLASASVSVSFDPGVLSARVASRGTLTSGWLFAANTLTPGVVTLSMASNGGAVSGSGSIAVIEFDVVGQPGQVSPLTITSASLNDGAIPVEVSPGSFTVDLVYSLSGVVSYWNEARPIPGTLLTATGQRLYFGTSGNDGTFSVQNLPAGDYSLAPSKSTGAGGISAFDASLALQHDTQLITLTGDAFIAADVNRNGQVTALDAFNMLQHAVGLTGLPFPGAGVVWLFNPTNRSVTGLSSDLGGQSFTGILFGDPSGNWVDAGLVPVTAEPRPGPWAAGTTLMLPAMTIRPGQTTEVPMLLSAPEAPIFGADIVLGYDPAVITAISVIAGPAIPTWAIATNLSESGVIRVAAAGAQALTEAGEILKLRFTAVGDLGEQSVLSFTRGDLNEGSVPLELLDGVVTVEDQSGIFTSGFEQ
jgi:subtilisin family serine protease